MVHRWAAANLRGDTDHDTAASQAEAKAAADLLGWYSEGIAALIDTVHATAEDAKATVFLNDAPPPRRFWARRLAHETTIHSVDAISAVHQRWPTALDVDIDPALAADGIDELLTGFITRGRGRLYSADPHTVLVRTDDTGHAWTLRISEGPIVTNPGGTERPDVVFSGTAVQLDWGGEATVAGSVGDHEWHDFHDAGGEGGRDRPGVSAGRGDVPSVDGDLDGSDGRYDAARKAPVGDVDVVVAGGCGGCKKLDRPVAEGRDQAARWDIGGLRGGTQADVASGHTFVHGGEGIVDVAQQCRQVPCRTRGWAGEAPWCDANEAAAEGVADGVCEERGVAGGSCHAAAPLSAGLASRGPRPDGPAGGRIWQTGRGRRTR